MSKNGIINTVDVNWDCSSLIASFILSNWIWLVQAKNASSYNRKKKKKNETTKTLHNLVYTVSICKFEVKQYLLGY